MLWNISNGTLINMFNHPPKIRSLVSIRSGSYFASSNESNVIIWDCNSFKKSITLNDTYVKSFAYNAGNDILATGNRCSFICIWRVYDWKKLKTIKMNGLMNGSIISLAFLPNGTLASGAKEEDKIRICCILTGNILQEFNGHINGRHGHIESLIVLPNENLASLGSGTIKVWNIENWQAIKTFDEHSHWINYINHMSLLLSGNLVSCSSQNKQIKIWNINNETNQILDIHSNTLAVSSGGALASVSNDNSIQIWKD